MAERKIKILSSPGKTSIPRWKIKRAVKLVSEKNKRNREKESFINMQEGLYGAGTNLNAKEK